MSKFNNIIRKNYLPKKQKIKSKESIKFSDILSIPSNPEDLFTLLYPIGHGAFGTVYKALHNSSNQVYAIKIIDYSKDNNKENNNIIDYNYNSVQQETSLMRKVDKSDYIVKYYGSYFSRKSNTIWLILEYCSSGSAIDLMLSMDRTFSEVEVATIMEMILKGLILMHKENLIHRDIKGANILISEEGYAKLGDFGVGELLSEKKYSISKKGSPYWMSPQVASSTKYDYKTDIWSLGITCIELLEGEPPFSDMKPNNVMERISKKPPTPCEIIDLNEHTPEFQNFVEHCLEKDPNKRFSAKELINHEFIRKFSKGRKYLKNLVKEYQADVEKFRVESEEEYQKLMKNKEMNKDNEFVNIDDNNLDKSSDENYFCEIEKIHLNGTFQENNINGDNLDSLDDKMKKFLNNNNKKEEKKKEKVFTSNPNKSLKVCYTESINTLDDKSSINKENNDNIIILGKGIKKKKNEIQIKNEENSQNINNINNNNLINYIKDEFPKILLKNIEYDKLNMSASSSIIKHSTTNDTSKRDFIEENKINKDNKEFFDNDINDYNICEEFEETKREKKPKNTSYNFNNISFINDKYKINELNEEDINESDDEEFIRTANKSISSLKYLDKYINQDN